MKLIKCVDYITIVENADRDIGQDFDAYNLMRLIKIFRYKAFISQNLSERYTINTFSAHPLNRFLPCDLDGNVLSEPKGWIDDGSDDTGLLDDIEYRVFQEAKSRVIFKGFSVLYGSEENPVKAIYNRDLGHEIRISDFHCFSHDTNFDCKTIEDLGDLDLELTVSAISTSIIQTK